MHRRVLLRRVNLGIQPHVAFPVTVRSRAKRLKVKEALVHEKRRSDIRDSRGDAVGAAWRTCLPLPEKRFHLLPLQIVLRSAQVAGDDRKSPKLRITGEVRFLHKGKRANDEMPAIF